MMLILIMAFVVVACCLAVFQWRWGVFAAIVMALLQDPLRKMVPGAPGYLAMCSMPVWMSMLGMALYSQELSARRFFSGFPRLSRWVLIFGFYLLIPAVISFSYGQGTWQITLLGATVYICAFFMLLAGWRFPSATESLSSVFSFYAICTSIALIGGPLDYFGVFDGWLALGTEAMDTIWMTARTGEIIYMYAGFFRGPDVMGWHASMVVMIASLLALRSRGWSRWFWIGISIWAFLNLWICGRRKMIAMLPVFWATLLFLSFKLRSANRLVALAAVALMIVGAGWYGVTRTYRATAVDTFYGTISDDWDDRIMQHGVHAVIGTIHQAGFFGYGLGMGQQGIHHIQAEKPRIWQEGGPGKVVAELGVPGGILLLCMGAVLFRTAYYVIGTQVSEASFYLSAGTFSLLIANVASAVVSAQIFGDLFIILFLVFLAGALLAGARGKKTETLTTGTPES
jgi:hypothetical protein